MYLQARHHYVDGQLKNGGLALQAVKAQNVRIPGRMFSLQQSLPRLPVPALQQTLDKYLRTAKPLLSVEEYQHAQEVSCHFVKSCLMNEKTKQCYLVSFHLVSSNE